MVKPIVLLLVIPVIGVSLSADSAEAQRSGSLQATARVVDTRQSVTGLQSAYTVAAQLARGQKLAQPVENSIAQVSLERLQRDEGTRLRTASITINYLRN